MTPTELKGWRDALALKTQREAAELLGVSRTEYVRWETGVRPIPHWLPLVCAAIWHRIKPWPACASA